MKREVLRKITASVCSFGTAVFLTVAIFSLLLGVFFSKPYFSILTGDGYKQKVEAEVLDALEGYAIPGGLPQDFFSEKVDRALLKKDVDRAVDAAFRGESVSFESFRAATEQSILSYAEENNITVEAGEDSTEENISRMVEHCHSSYKKFVNSEIIKFSGAIARFLSPAVWLVALVAFASAAGLIYALMKIGGKTYLRMALGGAGAMLLLFPLYMLLFRNVSSLGITSPSMYSLTTGIIYSLLISLLVFAVLLLVAANIPYKKKTKSEE